MCRRRDGKGVVCRVVARRVVERRSVVERHRRIRTIRDAYVAVTYTKSLRISPNGETLLRRYPRRNGMRSLAHDVV